MARQKTSQIFRRILASVAVFCAASAFVLGYLINDEFEDVFVSQVGEVLHSITEAHSTIAQAHIQNLEFHLVLFSQSVTTSDAFFEFSESIAEAGGASNIDTVVQGYTSSEALSNGKNDRYDEAHQSYHGIAQNFVDRAGIHNIYMLDENGLIIYAFEKGQVVGKNIESLSGRFASIKDAFSTSVNAESGNVKYTNFSDGITETDQNLAHFSTRFNTNRGRGVLIFTVTGEFFARTLSGNANYTHNDPVLHETASEELSFRIYLVSDDNKLLTAPLDHALASSQFGFDGDTGQDIAPNDAVIRGSQGESGLFRHKNDAGNDVLFSFFPIDVGGKSAVIFAELLVADNIDGTHSVRNTNSVVVILSMVLVMVIFFFVARTLNTKLYTVHDQMRTVSEGNLDIELELLNDNDEFGEIARSLKTFKDSAQERLRLEEETSNQEALSDSNRRKEVLDRVNDFRSDVYEIIQSVASSATQLDQTASTLSSQVEDLNVSTEEAVGAAEGASKSVHAVTSTAEQLSSSLQEIISHVALSGGAVSRAVSVTVEANQAAQQLSETTLKIEEILELINGIASQINLLALNATIESARAGDAGKGFAVVAGEVKNLASQTSTAIEDISGNIEAMREVSNGVVDSLVDIEHAITRVHGFSTNIHEAVRAHNDTTSHITENMQSTADLTTGIGSSLSEISNITSETRRASSSVLNAATELSKQSEALNGRLSEFISSIEQREDKVERTSRTYLTAGADEDSHNDSSGESAPNDLTAEMQEEHADSHFDMGDYVAESPVTIGVESENIHAQFVKTNASK